MTALQCHIVVDSRSGSELNALAERVLCGVFHTTVYKYRTSVEKGGGSLSYLACAMGKMHLTEQEIRSRTIRPAIVVASWTAAEIREQYHFTTGRIGLGIDTAS